MNEISQACGGAAYFSKVGTLLGRGKDGKFWYPGDFACFLHCTSHIGRLRTGNDLQQSVQN